MIIIVNYLATKIAIIRIALTEKFLSIDIKDVSK